MPFAPCLELVSTSLLSLSIFVQIVCRPNPTIYTNIHPRTNPANPSPPQDMLFIGPNDLALSVLGYVPARGDEPAFVEAIEKIVAAARKHKKWVGRLSNDGKASKEHLEVFDTVALSYDVRAMQNWYFAELEAARGG